jgi:hypothetical protein
VYRAVWARKKVGVEDSPRAVVGLEEIPPPPLKRCPAASYSPTPSPGQYHRRCRAELPGSEWDRAFPPRYDHRNTVENGNPAGPLAPHIAVGVVVGVGARDSGTA